MRSLLSFPILLLAGLLTTSGCKKQESPSTHPDAQGTTTALAQESDEPNAEPNAKENDPESEIDELEKFEDPLGKGGERAPDVSYVPTPQPVVDKMLELVKLKKDDVVYDLGCGDGRIVVTAAKKYGVRAYGFDIDPVRVAEAKENVKKNGVESLVTIQEADVFKLDLSPASVVTLYLLPHLNVKLIPQLKKLKPGSRIVSHDFDMAGVKPDLHLEFSDERKHDIYLFTTPLKEIP